MVLYLIMPEADIILYYAHLFNNYIGKIFEKIDGVVIKKKIIDVDCNGKHLWFLLEGDEYIHIHLGLTGIISKNGNKHIYKNFLIDDNMYYIEDKLRLTKIDLCNHDKHNEIIDRLGVYIFSDDFTLESFRRVIVGRKNICNALLDQKKISGIGNYIKNESLFLAGINVDSRCNQLSKEDVNNLYISILFVSYSLIYTSLNDIELIVKYYNHGCDDIVCEIPYIDKIYGKTCLDDGRIVGKKTVGGRTTYFIET